jgi:hypothetical protein
MLNNFVNWLPFQTKFGTSLAQPIIHKLAKFLSKILSNHRMRAILAKYPCLKSQQRHVLPNQIYPVYLFCGPEKGRLLFDALTRRGAQSGPHQL